MMNRLQMAEQFRKAVQLYANTLDNDSALIIATVFDEWAVNKEYKIGDYLTYGLNEVNDPQLYQVLQAHTSQEDWKPDEATSLYKAIGIDEHGYPEWVQPVGASDAYRIGDIVSFEGRLYICISDYNVYPPNVYGWDVYEPAESN